MTQTTQPPLKLDQECRDCHKETEHTDKTYRKETNHVWINIHTLYQRRKSESQT